MEKVKDIIKDYESSQKRFRMEVTILPTLFRDEEIDLMQNAGFDTVELNEYQFGVLGEKIYEKVIEVLEDRGFDLRYSYFGEGCGSTGLDRIKNYDFTKHPKIWSVHPWDEPPYQKFDELKEVFEFIEANIPEKVFVASCLFPVYANKEQVGAEYEEYVDKYFRYVLQNMKHGKAASCDYYPFFHDEHNRSVMFDTWVYNHMLFAKMGKKYNAEIHWCIQTSNYVQHRIVDAQDVKMQLYMCMAFGVVSVCFFTYATPLLHADFSNGGGGMIGPNYKPTLMYHAGKDAIAEIRKVEKFYMGFKWQGTKTFVGKNNVFGKRKDFEYLTEEMEKFTRIDNVSCSEDTVISELYDAENDRYGYVIVNYNDPIQGKTDDIKFTIKDQNNCVAFIKGEPVEFSSNAEFTLERGGGALIIIAK